ncbi:MinD/ParA family protein [Tepidibacter hydrothermalis]|uniref:MinD/ParA family protein n=1 Tax=Tepidibacter hydrothermalis TaxID=3036126 RepID=A0ABY8EIB9_9FIRM|nr:MinD/ParA family protein [Tepidibacter hydrothermalis]WFD11695.1 MinD/ParA family protein [Tepidibacter hydrothermalis]
MDQASKLRSAILKKNKYNYLKENKSDSNENPRVICVSSGKGGVGKTNFTLNLSLALKKKGNRVLVIDADLGLANIEILLGIDIKYGFIDLVEDDIKIEDIMVDGPLGIKIISGGAGISEVADLPIYKINKILNNLVYLKEYVDFILIDTGAGISKSVMSFVLAAQEVIVVTTPEPTSIADAYALIKVITKKTDEKAINMVINRADNQKEAEITFKKMNMVSERFLNKDIKYLGYISDDKNVRNSVKNQIPFLLNSPNCLASKNIENICDSLLGNTENKNKFNNFINKLSNLFLGG